MLGTPQISCAHGSAEKKKHCENWYTNRSDLQIPYNPPKVHVTPHRIRGKNPKIHTEAQRP